MASSLAKHRYLLIVATGGGMDSSAGVSNFLRRATLEALGEVGLGRLQPLVKVFCPRLRVAVLRVRRDYAKAVPELLGSAGRVVVASGSARACRPRALKLLRDRHAAAGRGTDRDDRDLERAVEAVRTMGT